MIESSCKYCEQKFLSSRKDAKCCKNKNCINEAARLTYSLRLTKKKCKECQQFFDGKRQETLCIECKCFTLKRRFLGLDKVQVNIFCRKCNTFIEKVEKYKTKTRENKKSINICQNCKKHSKNRYRGNREHDHIVRTRLCPWKKKCFEKSSYSCEECGKTNCYLEVHHSEKLKDIYLKFINKPLRDYDRLSLEFEELIKAILNYHLTNNIGIVYCKECHAKNDPQRRIGKNKENKENSS